MTFHQSRRIPNISGNFLFFFISVHSADQRAQINVGIYQQDICKNNILHYRKVLKLFLFSIEYLRDFDTKIGTARKVV